MTKRYTTDELIEKLYDHWKYKAYAEGMMHHNEYRDAIVERLKAADELCEAVLDDYHLRVSPGVVSYDVMPVAVRKAIKKYEEV